MNTYLPGQSVRFSVTATLFGVLASPPTLVLTVHGPQVQGSQRTTLTPSVTLDSTGQYHGDVVIPLNASPGPWTARWVAPGSDPTTTGLVEDLFVVQPLSY